MIVFAILREVASEAAVGNVDVTPFREAGDDVWIGDDFLAA